MFILKKKKPNLDLKEAQTITDSILLNMITMQAVYVNGKLRIIS